MEIEQPKRKYLEISDSLIRKIVACSELNGEQNDVLGANEAFEHLPHLISANDYPTIIAAAEVFGGIAQDITPENSTLDDLRIAQRDLAMWLTAATLLTPSEDEIPVAEKIVPGAAEQLLRLSKILDLTPRITDKTWTGLMPRYFTDREVDINGVNVRAEAIIKICVGENWERQDETSQGLLDLSATLVDDPRFPELIAKSRDDLAVLVPSIAVVKKDLTNEVAGMEYFMQEFMPQTMPIIIGGKVRHQSGSQYLAMHASDAILGITNPKDPQDKAYLEQALSSASQEQVAQFRQIQTNIAKNGTLTEQVFRNPSAQGAQGVLEMLEPIVQFRTAHANAIKASKAYRPEGESSGGQLTMAEELQARSVMLRNLVKDAVKKDAA